MHPTQYHTVHGTAVQFQISNFKNVGSSTNLLIFFACLYKKIARFSVLGAGCGCRGQRVVQVKTLRACSCSPEALLVASSRKPYFFNIIFLRDTTISRAARYPPAIMPGGYNSIGPDAQPGLRTYVDGKADGPTIVFVHGWPDDHALWDKQVRLRECARRVQLAQVPGLPQSARCNKEF